MTPKQIANLGLSKLGSSRVQNLTPPTSPLERHVAEGYDAWMRSELAKRRWLFVNKVVDLTPTGAAVDGLNAFQMPGDCVRLIRGPRDTWVRRGNLLYEYADTLSIEYSRSSVPEAEWHPLFVDVAAIRVALETVEYVTQSNVKLAQLERMYEEAIATAGQANAYERGPEKYDDNEDAFSWVSARFNYDA
jgi:hypothetical protein